MPANSFLTFLSAPAQRALENEGITTLKKLSAYSEADILKLHGMGKASMPVLKKLLKEKNLQLKTTSPVKNKKSNHLDWLRKKCLSLHGATEAPHFEKTSFRIKKKIFATYDIKKDKACFKLKSADQDVFSLAKGGAIYPVPNKWGQQGWTFAEMNIADKRIVAQLITSAYEAVVE